MRQRGRRARHVLPDALLAVILCVLPAVPVLSQPFPSKAVHMVMPYAAGGSGDLLARALAKELSTLWGQPVVVENIAGANSIIGTQKVVTAPADGYTLLLTITPTAVTNRFLYKKLPYDPDKSLIPITMIARSGSFVIVHPSVPANNLRELIEAARRAPGKIAYSSYGIGAQPHLVLETIAKREGVQFLHVPYKGIAPSTAAVVSGEVQTSVGTPAANGAMVKAGRVKALAITSPRRTDLFPDVPTTAEAGYPYAVSFLWFGLFVRDGTDQQLVERIHRDVIGIAKRPEFTEKYITALSLDLVANTPAEFADAIRDEVAGMAEMVKAAGVQPE